MESSSHRTPASPCGTECGKRGLELRGTPFGEAQNDAGHWSNASPIRKIFQDAFQAAGLPYFNPHSLRNILVHLGQTICQTPEEFKARSQNLGHEGVMTTFFSYGEVGESRQGEIIRDLAKPRQEIPKNADQFLRNLMEIAARKVSENLRNESGYQGRKGIK